MINPLENQFRYYLKNYGVTALVDGVETTAFFKEIENSTGNDTKYLFADIGILKQGSIVDALNHKWIVVNKETNFNDIYDKALVRKVRFNINFIIDDTLVSVPAIVDNKAIDINTGKYFTLDESKIIVTVPSDYIINAEDRFIKMSSAWKVVSKDETKENLVSLYCQRDSILVDDDLENEIPAGLSTWTIEIVEEITEIQENNTINLTAKVYKDSVEQQGIGITWESSNDSIATVDNGVVSAIAVGEVNIIAKITDKPTIMDTQTITVTEEVQEVITYELSGVSTINWGATEEYNAIKKSNGSPISANFTFEVVSDGGKSTYYTLNVVDNDTCNIQHNSVGNANIILRATDNETMEYIEKSILIKNIF